MSTARARAIYERELTPEEFDRRLSAILADAEEVESMRELVRWFRSAYPTPQARLAYARRKAREMRSRGDRSE